MKVRTAVVVDNLGTMSQTPDDERDEIMRDLEKDYGLDAELVHYGHDVFEATRLTKQIDCLVVDYGAL